MGNHHGAALQSNSKERLHTGSLSQICGRARMSLHEGWEVLVQQ
jgi:hypothetical protein